MEKINKCDPFIKLSVKVTGTPRTYTILHHILLTEFTPRELATLERVSKNWNKTINSDTELWWNTWMDLVWQQNHGSFGNNKSTISHPRMTEKNLKELVLLQNSLSFTEYNNNNNSSSSISEILDDSSSVCSSVTTLTELSSFDINLSGKSIDSVCTLKKSKKISRSERKRGPKVWKKLAIEEFRKQEVRNVFKSDEIESDSDDTIVVNSQEQSNTRGKLTSEEKLEARRNYKMGKSKPKTKNNWRNESNISREWIAFNDYYID